MAITLSKESLNREQATEKAAQAMVKLQEMQLVRKLGTMLTIALAVAAGLYVFFWSQKPDYSPLYTGLDPKATAEATDLLRSAQIPFKLDQATGAISVPEKHLHDARLKLAGSGLADSGRLGFELMERDPGFGVSQFVESARYQHALETELVRTIATLRPVRDARVHLAIPKPSAFTRQREAASASVMLELRSGTLLERNQVDAIVHLVSSSIPDLAPERVTVVDQNGRLLSRNGTDSASELSAVQFEQVRRQETSYSQRIRELLEPLTGSGRVNAEVTVDVDFSVTEEARELFNGEPPKLRSEQVSENTAATADGPQGIPGATSNTPPGAAAPADPAAAPPAAAAAAVPTETSRSATRNFELDRTLQHTRQPAGRIRRVTAAVLVDHVPRTGTDGKAALQPLGAEELKRVEELVRQAVGFDANRGDVVSVVNAPFVRETGGEALEPAKWWEDPRLRDALRLVLGAAVVLALLFGVLRPTLRQIAAPAPKPRPGHAQQAEVALVDDEDALVLAEDTARIAAARQPIALTSNAYDDRLRNAREAVKTDSKRVAQVVKDWLGNETA
ncbi:flagellar M-ring protein FliF [Pseudoxanthomonas broegbernensis]|uniref:Flagellar M-ring protein n=1 Tax=Pseudoxanthomonas broegbernensis TaxID=83619 RepID=A0A7V8GLA7_9GAMM|nr:flagellar basal-body MS-ring/collar protein FliF [Pseudoxanthomonas broegbernensis]KAF1685604.1 flagellar M-ring protein FliF [Pseudoxanthomonas broegbernensis]MBB6065979.1 flagellar M-ring protein FliF [Pseudoxanthomonas broegbernensis]